MQLRSGRQLAWAEYGDAAGSPVFHFHGHPGSRLEGRLAASHAARAGVRLIAVDRPGMGASDFDPTRRLLDWPGCVAELADRLGLDRFAVQGASGGGPYALACAFGIPDRLTACGVIAGLGPIDRLGTRGMMLTNRLQFGLAKNVPWLLRPMFWAILGRHRRRIGNPTARRRLIERWSRGLKRTPEFEAVAEAYVAETLEAFRQGSRGAAYDARLYTEPWGFGIEEIRFSEIFLWHGEDDVNVPVDMARAVANALPVCHARYYPGETHMGVILGRLGEVLDTMKNPGGVAA